MGAIDRLHVKFTAMAHNEPIDLEILEDAVCAFVDEMKEQGEPPEVVIVAAKQAAADAGLVPSSEQSLFLTNDYADHMLGDIVRWCIQQYYDGAVQPGELFRAK